MNRAVHQLHGIGPKTAAGLAEVGIATEAELRQIGAVAAYRRLKHYDPRGVSRNALWALYGALNDLAWTDIDPAIKRQLLAEAGEG